MVPTPSCGDHVTTTGQSEPHIPLASLRPNQKESEHRGAASGEVLESRVSLAVDLNVGGAAGAPQAEGLANRANRAEEERQGLEELDQALLRDFSMT